MERVEEGGEEGGKDGEEIARRGERRERGGEGGEGKRGRGEDERVERGGERGEEWKIKAKQGNNVVSPVKETLPRKSGGTHTCTPPFLPKQKPASSLSCTWPKVLPQNYYSLHWKWHHLGIDRVTVVGIKQEQTETDASRSHHSPL